MAELSWRDDGERETSPVTTSHPIPAQIIRPDGDPIQVRPGVPLVPTCGDTGAMTGTTATVCIPAPGPTESILVTQLTITNNSATATTVAITGIIDGRSRNAVTYHAAAAANNGGSVLFFNPPLIGGPGNAISATCITTGTSTYMSGNGFVVESTAERTN